MALWCRSAFGVLLVMRGEFKKGIKLIEEQRDNALKSNAISSFLVINYLLANVYLNMVTREMPVRIPVIIKNMGFLIKTLPFAAKKAEQILLSIVNKTKNMRVSLTAPSYMNLAKLYKHKGKKKQAKELIVKAIEIFKENGNYKFLEQAEAELKLIEIGYAKRVLKNKNCLIFSL
jgi:tetratricopeptide (TPR) repeat protein